MTTDTQPKTHIIDGIQYIEDGKPEPGATVQAPIIYDGVLLKGGQAIPDWVIADGVQSSKTILLRRLEP